MKTNEIGSLEKGNVKVKQVKNQEKENTKMK